MSHKKLLRAIWSLAKAYGLAKGDDRTKLDSILLRQTGKTSMKLCSDAELKKVLAYIKAHKTSEELKRPGLSTAQEKKLFALAYALDWDKKDGVRVSGRIEKRINGFCKKMAKVENYRWLSAAQAHQIIEGMKAMATAKGGNHATSEPVGNTEAIPSSNHDTFH